MFGANIFSAQNQSENGFKSSKKKKNKIKQRGIRHIYIFDFCPIFTRKIDAFDSCLQFILSKIVEVENYKKYFPSFCVYYAIYIYIIFKKKKIKENSLMEN